MSECKNIVPKTTGNGIVPTLAEKCDAKMRPYSRCFKTALDISVCEEESSDANG